MKKLLNYTFGNVNENNLNFHYLRVGNTKPLIDELRKISEIENINYDYHKTDSFKIITLDHPIKIMMDI